MSFEVVEAHSVRELLEDARMAFDGFRRALQDRIKLLKEEQKVEKTAEIARQLQELHKLLGIAVDMTRKVQDAQMRETGGHAVGELDLDAARLEIRSRVARLRAARRSGNLSGGFE